MTKQRKVFLILTITVILLWIPFTRYAIFWLLPVGSGIDDLIFVIVLIATLFVAFVKGWISLPSFIKGLERTQNDD